MNLPADPSKIYKIATDYDNAIKYLPPYQVKSIKVVERKGNETITEEILTFEAIKFQEILQRTSHKLIDKNIIQSDIIKGPLKGTSVQLTLGKNDSGTTITIKANLKLTLKYKILTPLIKTKYKTFLTAVLYKMNTAAMELS